MSAVGTSSTVSPKSAIDPGVTAIGIVSAPTRPVRLKVAPTKCLCCSQSQHHPEKKPRIQKSNGQGNAKKGDSDEENDSEADEDDEELDDEHQSDSDEDEKKPKRRNAPTRRKPTPKVKQDKDVRTWWWEYYVDQPIDAKSIGWYKYEAGANASVEREYQVWKQNGSPPISAMSMSPSSSSSLASAYQIDTGKYRYGLDWTNMTQTNLTLSSHTVRKIRRLQVVS